MSWKIGNWIFQKLSKFLSKEGPRVHGYLTDFDRLVYEIRPGDVLLIEGTSRMSNIIKKITQSQWTHAALYIGRLHDIENPELRKKIREHLVGQFPADRRLIIESFIGKGTYVAPLTHYRKDHIRICRPQAISRKDAQKVIAYAIDHLGREYSIRHVFDLMRFMLPWGILPRRFLSTLFKHPKEATREICSSMIAEAFMSIDFPILPHIRKTNDKEIEMIQRNPRLFSPPDFDQSPYFNIIKYPIYSMDEQAPYKNLPWNKEVISHDDHGIHPAHEMGPIKPEEEIKEEIPEAKIAKKNSKELAKNGDKN